MSSSDTCQQTAGSACPAPPSLPLTEVLERFRREAVHGVCDTGRYRCPYFTWGQGPPLVFIHGLADSSRSFLPVIALLTGQFRCISYELPKGRGDRARVWEYRHDDLVADLFALLDHLGLQQSYVYGSSFGSTIALAAAYKQPKRLPRVVLQGGFANRPLFRGELLLARIARYLPGIMGGLPLRERLIRRAHFAPFAGLPAEAWQYCLQCTATPPVSATGYHALILNRVDLRPLLPEIRQPVLLLCGDCDPLIGRAHEEVLLKGLPNADRITISGCGHTPTFTHPELLAALIRDFLTPPG
ncbi:MAG: alpha/beta fold hydrolase [Gemmataceae bacterium]